MINIRLRTWSRLRLAIALLTIAIALVPTIVFAAEFATGDNVVINAPVNDDLYAYGFEIEVNADVTGDVIAAGLAVYINGDVAGSVYAVSGSEVIIRGNVGGTVMASSIQVQIYGDVGGPVRVAARSLDIVGSAVGGDVVTTAADIHIAADSTVGGDVELSVSDAEILGDVDGSINGQADSAEIGGAVSGSVDLDTDSLRITSDGAIEGDIVVTSDHQPIVERGSSISGSIETIEPEHETLSQKLTVSIVFAILRFGFALPLGILAIWIMPEYVRRTAYTLHHRPFASLGWGILSLIGIPLLILFLAITVFGIPIAMMLSILFVIAIYASQLVLGLVVGQLIAPKSWRADTRRRMMIRMLVIGLAIVVVARSLPIPNWTTISSVLIAIFALGAISVTTLRYLRGETQFDGMAAPPSAVA